MSQYPALNDTEQNLLKKITTNTAEIADGGGGGGSGTVTHTTGALTANSIILGNGASDVKATTTGTGIVAALGVNVGSAGAPVVNGGALGTPSSGVATNLTGTAAGLTAGTATAVAASGITAGTLTATVTLGETVTTGGIVLYDAALSADGRASGFARAGTAGAALAFGDLVYLAAADSRWELADADSATTSGNVLLGMCILAAAADGDPTTILLHGFIRADAAFPAMTISAPQYVSATAGDITGTAPSTTGQIVRRVGFAWTADELYFNPSMDSGTAP